MRIHAERIVTLAPALTEIVFALGKGDDIVGNTKFCNFPEEAKKISRVGGYFDTNLEILVHLKPDVIFLYPEAYEKLKIMEKRARLVRVKHTCMDDLFEAVAVIAKTLNVEEKGKELTAKIKGRLEQVRQKAAGKKKRKVLLIIGRNRDKLSNMFIVGKRDFLNQLLETAGGENAYTGDITYPSISIESVMAMKPDVIIELSAFNEGISDEQVMELWGKYPFIPAVKKKRIYVIKDDLWVIPGPRTALIAEKMQRLFYRK
jgi:iron complex transport system substrate-binding protein